MGGIFDWIGKAFRNGAAAGMAPNPPGSSSTTEGGGRSYYGGNGSKAAATTAATAAAVVATKMPGTPRREAGSGHAREKAVQDPGLKDYVRLSSFSLPPVPFLPGVCP